MDAICMGWNRTTRRCIAGVVSVMAATLLVSGTATAAPRATSEFAAHQASGQVGSYFGLARTTAGYIPGL
jgi:ATP-dependent protease ClpP protease subunit